MQVNTHVAIALAVIGMGLSSLGEAVSARHLVSFEQGYQQLKRALLSGKNVAVSLRLEKCILSGTTQAGPNLQGGTRIHRFLITEDQHIAFSDAHQTLNGENWPVTEYILYDVSPDGGVQIRTAFANSANRTATQRATYQCMIGNGVEFHW